MNIYVIPTWYPNPRQPMSGIFTKEQAKLISEQASIEKVIVQDHGFSISHLSPLNIFGIIESIYWRLNTKKKIIINNDFIEIFDPIFTWPEKIPFGGVSRLVSHSKEIFLRAQDQFGEINLIHAHVCFPAGYIAYEISKLCGVPYVITEHMSPFPFKSITEQDGRLKKKIDLAFKNAKNVIAVSDELKLEMENHGIQNIKTIGNLVDEDFFRIQEKEKNQPFSFFSFGRLHPQKGFDTLFEAIKILKNEGISINFRIGGRGPYENEYRLTVKKLGIENYISWLGELSRYEALIEYQNCDAYLLASRHESFGMTYIEALACGKPIIATKCGAPENFINKDNGILIEKENPIDLANAIKKIINNYYYDSNIIREDCIRNFSKKNVINEIIKSYQ